MSDASVSKKINAIREKALKKLGATMDYCPTCVQPADAPYRRLSPRGTYTEGCVDAYHHGHLYGGSLEWHMRPGAQRIRARELESLLAVGSGKRARASS